VWSRLVVPGAAFRKSGPQIGLFGVPVEPAADIGAFGHDPETAGTGILDQRLDKLPGDSESAHLGRSVGMAGDDIVAFAVPGQLGMGIHAGELRAIGALPVTSFASDLDLLCHVLPLLLAHGGGG